MSKKYCKKSSVQSVANEVKVRKGSASSIQGSGIASDIDDLVLPTQRGAPNTALTASSTSKTIQRGKYTGGSVYVTGQGKTVTLKSSSQTISADTGKVLTSVTVPAKNVNSVATGSLTPSNNATSITVSGLSFRPVGMAVVLQRGSTSVVKPKIGGFIYNNGQINGIAAGGTTYGSYLTSVSASITDNSITLSNFVVSENGSTFTANFINYQVAYMVWG